MLTKLEEKRRLCSTVFLGMSVITLVPIIILAHNAILSISASILLAAHFIIAAFYFFKGIALAVMHLVYLLLFSIGATLSILPTRLILPDFITSDTLRLAGIIFVLIFTIQIPLPRKARAFILKRLGGNESTDNNESNDPARVITIYDIVANVAVIKAREFRGVPYGLFVSYRGATMYNNSPYSYESASPQMRKLRLAIGFVLLGLSFAGLIIANMFDDSSATSLPLNSWAFWVGISSVVALIVAATILIAGFTRGLVAIFGCIGLGIIGYYAYKLIERASEISVFLLIFGLVLLVLIICTGFWKFLMLITKRARQTLQIYEENDCLYAVDAFLANTYPIIDLAHCLHAKIMFDEKARLKDFDSFNADLLLYCANRKMIFAGAILDQPKQTYSVYIYYPATRYEKRIRRYFKRTIRCKTEIVCRKDAEWKIYETSLAPSDTMLIKMHNRNLIQNLQKANYDFSQQYPFVFAAVFEKKDDALLLLELAKQQRYEKAYFLDNLACAKTNILEKYFYYVHVQTTITVSEAWLNLETLKFHGLAQKTGGELRFIIFGSLDESLYDSENKESQVDL